MISVEKEYRAVLTRIGFSLLFFLLLSNVVMGGAEALSMFLNEIWTTSDFIYISTDLISSIAYMASFILPVPFFYIISRGIKKQPLNLSVRLPESHSFFKLVAIVWAGIAIIVPMAYLNSLLFPISVDTTSDLFGFDFSEPYKLVLGFISTAVVPAFVEEFLFRGLIISNIKPYSKNAAVIISAVAFGLMHQNPAQLLYATAAGVILGLVYIETDSIWCCIALHFFNNFVSVLQTYLSSVMDEYVASMVVYFFDVFMVVGGMICAVLLLNTLKKRNKEKEAENIYGVFGSYDRVSPSFSGKINYVKNAFTTPTFMIFVILCAVQSVANGVLLLAL